MNGNIPKDYIDFDKVPINADFMYGDTLWHKQSTRTAHLVNAHRIWIYFGKKDPCTLK